MNHKITELYVWISADEGDGDEGLVATGEAGLLGGGMMMPLLTSLESLLPNLQNAARFVHGQTGKPMKLCKFQLVEVIQTIGHDKG